MLRCVEKYSNVRGFNFQPDWGAHGIAVWLKFDAERYRALLHNGKEKFPGMNTVRVWLSFDAWCEDRERYLANLTSAGKIVAAEGLRMIPVYLNGWFGLPSFGGFVPEHLYPAEKIGFHVYRSYIKDCAFALRDADVLCHDLSNEPINNVSGNADVIALVFRFLSAMAEEMRACDSRPVTIGSQGYLGMKDSNGREWSDIDLFAPIVDVFSLHPYNIICEDRPAFYKRTEEILRHVETFGKPVVVTECCWGAKTAEERIPYLETELPTYAELGLGFCCHALVTSPVADLHPLTGITHPSEGLYMAFLDEHGEIRKGHDIFNRY